MDDMHTVSNSTMNPKLEEVETPEFVFLSAKILIFVPIICVDLAMGCTLQPHDIRRQWNTLGGIFVGTLMQYIIFPFIAYILCHVLALPGPFSIGVALVGACPGSAFTALLTYYINGDVCLSLCITAVNSAVSIGFATAMLHLYSRAWTYETLRIAFWPLACPLCLHILMPAAGYFIRKSSEKVAWVVETIGVTVGVLSYTIECLIGLIGTRWAFLRPSWAKVSLAVLLLPALGWVSAYFLARLLRQNVWKRRSICAEILLHNVTMAVVILATTFYDFEYRLEMATVLGLFSPISGVYGVLVLVVYNLRAPWTKSGSEGLARAGELRDMAVNQNDAGSVSGESSDGEIVIKEQNQDQTKSEAMVSGSPGVSRSSRPSAQSMIIKAASKWRRARASTKQAPPSPKPMRISMV